MIRPQAQLDVGFTDARHLNRIEDAIGRFYARFQLSADRIERLRRGVTAELASQRQEAVAGVERAQKRRVRLQEERHKLLQAHYAGAVPQDMLASEMDRLTRGLTDVETEIKSATKTLDELEATLEQALAAAASCQREYEDARPSIRRQINQGFFKRLLIGPGGEVERVEMTKPFAALLGGGQVLTLDDAPQASQIAPDGRGADGRARGDGQAVATVSGVPGNAYERAQNNQNRPKYLFGRWFE